MLHDDLGTRSDPFDISMMSIVMARRRTYPVVRTTNVDRTTSGAGVQLDQRPDFKFRTLIVNNDHFGSHHHALRSSLPELCSTHSNTRAALMQLTRNARRDRHKRGAQVHVWWMVIDHE
jgi:hypothetical protein